MKLDKAKEILNLNLKEAGHKMPADCRDAVMLGIEAINRVQQYRLYPEFRNSALLPGESEP